MQDDMNNIDKYGFDYDMKPGVYQWYRSDTEEKYKQNTENAVRREILKENGWYPLHSTEQFNYTLNNYGFRTHEFPTQKEPDSIITLGCSLTMGIGIPNEYVWPVLLEKDLNRKVYNLGVGARCTESAFRYLYHWLPVIQSKTVIYAQHPGKRREYFNTEKQSWQCLGAWNQNEISHYFMNDREWSMAQERAIWAMRGLCSQYGAKFCHIPQISPQKVLPNGTKYIFHKGKMNNRTVTNPILPPSNPNDMPLNLAEYKGTLARDLEHPGTDYQQRMFESVLGSL